MRDEIEQRGEILAIESDQPLRRKTSALAKAAQFQQVEDIALPQPAPGQVAYAARLGGLEAGDRTLVAEQRRERRELRQVLEEGVDQSAAPRRKLSVQFLQDRAIALVEFDEPPALGDFLAV
ncbi:hypothetical protein GALL_258540 [mine drainage metagenome]|uniref:Uncharacterized protein n=1 Tax=mine drainage metagenome TaxID=410659 RepID=A0A1J5R8I9_9ZZZZ